MPVVTKTGNHFASRVSTSLLYSLDLDELCCDDMESYKNKIIEICKDEQIKSKILNKLKDKINTILGMTIRCLPKNLKKHY